MEQIILIAAVDKYFTDGETYGKTVVLPANADPSVWREVSEKELPKEPIE